MKKINKLMAVGLTCMMGVGLLSGCGSEASGTEPAEARKMLV